MGTPPRILWAPHKHELYLQSKRQHQQYQTYSYGVASSAGDMELIVRLLCICQDDVHSSALCVCVCDYYRNAGALRRRVTFDCILYVSRCTKREY